MVDWSQFKNTPIVTESPQNLEENTPASNDKWAQFRNEPPKESTEVPGLFPNVTGMAQLGKSAWEAIPGHKYLGGALSALLPEVKEEPGYEAHKKAGEIIGTGATIAALATPIGRAVNAVTAGATGSGLVTAGLTGGLHKVIDTAAKEGRMPTEDEIRDEAALYIGFDGAAKLTGKIFNEARKYVGGPPKVPHTTTEITQIGEKYGLKPIAATQIEEPLGLQPIISQKRAKSIRRETKESSKHAVKMIIQEKLPVAKAQASGVDVKKAYTDLYQEARDAAKFINNPVEIKTVGSSIDQQISKLKGKSPIPSESTQAEIDLLTQLKDKLGKNYTADQVMDQVHAFNDNVTGLYRKSTMTGLEQAQANAYGFVNKELINAMEHSSNKQVAQPFRKAQELFSKTQDLNKVNRLIENAFDKPNGLRSLLKSSKRNDLEKALGKDTVKHFDEIAKYQNAVETKLKEFAKTKDPNLSALSKVFGLVFELPKRAVGFMYTSPNVNNLYIRTQKAFLRNDIKEAKKLSDQLIKEIKTPSK